MRSLRYFAVPAVVCVMQVPAAGQSSSLSFQQALARAREQAPSVMAARARIEEARGRLAGAQPRFRENPIIDGSIGPRWAGNATLMDFDVGLSQSFETGGQRAARLAGAEAAIARETATADDVARLAVQEVALTFLRALHAQDRVAALTTAEATAREIADVTSRRFAAGDIAVLEVNVAKSAVARARSARLAAEADRAEQLGQLQRLLALPRTPTATLEGSLAQVPARPLESLIAAVDSRADLRAIRADIAEADADVQLAKAVTKPDIAVGARFKNEEGHRALLGEITLTLPVSNHGLELQVTGVGRAARLRVELASARAAAVTDIETTYAAYLSKRAAVEAFEQDVLPTLSENEALAQRSFEVGQISLPELLLLRRELLDARIEYQDRLLDAASAVIVQESIAGVLR